MSLSYLIYAEISSQAWFIVLVVRQAISLKACLVHWRPKRGRSDWKSKIEQRPWSGKTTQDAENEDEIVWGFFWLLVVVDTDVRLRYGQN